MKKQITLQPGKLGISFAGSPPRITKVSESSSYVGLIEKSETITGLIIPGVIEIHGFGTSQLLSLLKTYSAIEGKVLLVSSSGGTESEESGGYGSHIILKKTWKVKEYQVATEKSFSFHGLVPSSLIQVVNENLAMIKPMQGTGTIKLSLDDSGHYHANMTHNYQKYREEDALVCICDTMEALGYRYLHQFDSETSSAKVVGGSSCTSREMFLFHKD